VPAARTSFPHPTRAKLQHFRLEWRRSTELSLKPGSPDDIDDGDEDVEPDNGHIYVIDGPGTGKPPRVEDLKGLEKARIKKCVKIMNAVEMVIIMVGENPL
jgi:hypothetical protein